MKRKALLTLKVVGCAFALLAAAYVLIYVYSAFALRNAYAELKAAGRPMKVEDVIPKERPDSENAALAYHAAYGLLKAEKWDGTKTFFDFISLISMNAYEHSYGGIPFESAKDELHKCFQNDVFKMAFRMIEKGTEMPVCNLWSINSYASGPDMQLPAVNWHRCLTRILCVKATLEAEDGRSAEAWHTILIALKFADAMRDEPILICQFVRHSEFVMVFRTLGDISVTASPDARTLAELEGRLKTFEDRVPMTKAIDGDRLLFGGWVFDHPEYLSMVDPLPPPLLLAKFMFAYYKLYTEAALVKLIELSPAYRLDRATYNRMLGGLATAVLNGRCDWQVKTPWYCPVTKVMAGYDGESFFSKRSDVWAKIAKLSLRIIAKGGAARLSEVGAGDELIDPFSGLEFIYKPEGKGFILYSVGPDRKDDGGAPLKGKDGDIVWRWQGPH